MPNFLSDWDLWIRASSATATVLVAVVGWNLPRLSERRRRRKFLELLRRELLEMTPAAADPATGDCRWTSLLSNKGKRLIHRDMFAHPAASRDFILSLDADLAYSVTQMWSKFEQAEAMAAASEEQVRLARSFLDYLIAVARHVDGADIPTGPSQVARSLACRWSAELAKLYPGVNWAA